MSRLQTSFVLGYHGCDKTLGEQAVTGEIDLLHSKTAFDWLGSGIYFWEGDPRRAWEWAEAKAARSDYKEPFVIGAVIDLGNCLDLLVRENLELVKDAANSFAEVQKASGYPMPVNAKAPKDPSPDLVLRYLDCAVVNHLHSIIEGPNRPEGVEPFDTVRGLFGEGIELFPGSGFKDKTHSQIAVRNTDCIKGIFLPR
ncbi:hypothetical protein F2P47_00010 [Parvibaculum sedimenti]|uniref:DUF3990 domain-containing protein n=1 Tax=Parvibaculum sedimenti TaxID=2608632 RepID=A0A6N6VM04_9HYPH|nr:hypothetical protein [Parvibaculum sedimenti]KAB7742561.1 hypothetical protein F2P47_00010 [Parvibaculum sedimenti]